MVCPMASEPLQLIPRLTPLPALLGLIGREVKPVTPRSVDLGVAAGRILAADIMGSMRPSAPLALVDGWALRAEATLDAGGYAPALLATVPPKVEVGQAMPPGTDSVAPLDAVQVENGRAAALAPSIPATACCRRAAIACRCRPCAWPASACAAPISPPLPPPASPASPCASRACAWCRCA